MGDHFDYFIRAQKSYKKHSNRNYLYPTIGINYEKYRRNLYSFFEQASNQCSYCYVPPGQAEPAWQRCNQSL